MSALVDVVVVGAGPAGSTAAAMLARAGHRVTLVDRARFPRDKPCGDYCNPGGTRALRTLGVYHQLRACGAVPISSMVVRAANGIGFEAPFPSDYGLLMRRMQLDACLLAHAQRQGVHVQERTHILGIRYGEGFVEAVADGGRSLRARLLIAADGRHSRIGRSLGLIRPRSTGRFTVGAYFSGVHRRSPQGELHLGPIVYGGIAHFGEGIANVCLALPRAAFRQGQPDDVFHVSLQHLPILREALSGARRESAYRCSGPLGFTSHPVVAPRVLLVGDAAGEVDPMTGQGVSLALRSGLVAAQIAGQALTLGDFSITALHLYTRARGREIADTLRVAHWVQRFAFNPVLGPFFMQRLATHPGLASEFLGATGDSRTVGPGDVVRFLVRLSVGTDAHSA